MKHWMILGVACLPVAAFAAEEKHREHGAHEHGHGTFNMVIEGAKVLVELEAPGADIVGFEHEAKTKKQKNAVSDAKKLLGKSANVVELSAAAGCKMTEAKVELEGLGKADDHGHKHGHSHGKNDKHDKKEEAAEDSHSEFHVTYSFDCSAVQRLTEVRFPYFAKFKGAKELDVTVVGPSGQKQFEVTPAAAEIQLGGLI